MNNKFTNLINMIEKEEMEKDSIVFIHSEKKDEFLGRSFYNNINKMQSFFIDNGIKSENKVIIQIQSRKLFVFSILALIKIGALPMIVPVSLNKSSAERLKKVCMKNQGAILVTDKEAKGFIKFFVPNINLFSIEVHDWIFKKVDYEINRLRSTVTEPRDTALIIYSSGSTSEPKGVMLTHEGIIKVLEKTVNIFRLSQNDIFMAWLPIEHALGLIYFLFLPMYIGCKQIHLDTKLFAENPLKWFDVIDEYSATITAAPNFAFQLIIKNLDESMKWDLSCIRYIINAGEPISKKIMNNFISRNRKYSLRKSSIVPAYGMTETSGVIILNIPYLEPKIVVDNIRTGIGFSLDSFRVLEKDLVCQGTAISGCKIRIVDNKDTDLGEMNIGNIQLKSDFFCKGYINLSNECLYKDNWLDTGDLGFLCNGYLFVVGRKKDMFFMHGKNIYMRDIEQIIFDKYKVRSAACGEDILTKDKSRIYLFVELEVSNYEYLELKKEIIILVQREIGVKLEDVIFKKNLTMKYGGKISKSTLLENYKKKCLETNSLEG